MEQQITTLLLANRMLVAPGYETKILDLANKYNISMGLYSFGNYDSGPFIKGVFKKKSTILTVPEFKEYIKELVPCLDMYKGFMPFTYAEFYINVLIKTEEDKFTMPQRFEVVVFYSIEKNSYEIKSLGKDEKIRQIKNVETQKRINLNDIEKIKEISI